MDDIDDIKKTMQQHGLIKVSDDAAKEPVYRRVAKFLYIIGTDQAARVLRNLSTEQISTVTAELATIQSVPPAEAAQILQEFSDLYTAAERNTGGVGRARAMLKKAFGDNQAESILERAVPKEAPQPFDFLFGIESDCLFDLLHEEAAGTRALVLSQLPPKQAAAYIDALTSTEKTAVIHHLAKMKSVDREIVDRVHNALRQKFAVRQSKQGAKIDGKAILANMLKNSSAAFEHDILAALDQENPQLKEDIQKQLVTVDDVPKLEGRGFERILAHMSDMEVAALLYGKHELFCSTILSAVSKQRGRYILDERAAYVVQKKEAARITETFLAEVRKAKNAGELRVLTGSDEWIH